MMISCRAATALPPAPPHPSLPPTAPTHCSPPAPVLAEGALIPTTCATFAPPPSARPAHPARSFALYTAPRVKWMFAIVTSCRPAHPRTRTIAGQCRPSGPASAVRVHTKTVRCTRATKADPTPGSSNFQASCHRVTWIRGEMRLFCTGSSSGAMRLGT